MENEHEHERANDVFSFKYLCLANRNRGKIQLHVIPNMRISNVAIAFDRYWFPLEHGNCRDHLRFDLFMHLKIKSTYMTLNATCILIEQHWNTRKTANFSLAEFGLLLSTVCDEYRCLFALFIFRNLVIYEFYLKSAESYEVHIRPHQSRKCKNFADKKNNIKWHRFHEQPRLLEELPTEFNINHINCE